MPPLARSPAIASTLVLAREGTAVTTLTTRARPASSASISDSVSRCGASTLSAKVRSSPSAVRSSR